MKNRFMNCLLSSFEFPVALRGEIITTYTSRFTPELVANRSFGELVVPLVATADPDTIDLAVLRSGNPAAFSALMARSNLDTGAIITAVRTWRLSAKDQINMVERYLESGTKLMLLSGDDLLDDTRERLGEESSLRRTSCTWAPEVSMPRTPKDDFIGRAYDALLRVPSSARLAMHVLKLGDYPHGLYPFEAEITSVLGDATSSDSLTAWRTFFKLVETDPDVELGSVLDVARVLACDTD